MCETCRTLERYGKRIVYILTADMKAVADPVVKHLMVGPDGEPDEAGAVAMNKSFALAACFAEADSTAEDVLTMAKKLTTEERVAVYDFLRIMAAVFGVTSQAVEAAQIDRGEPTRARGGSQTHGHGADETQVLDGPDELATPEGTRALADLVAQLKDDEVESIVPSDRDVKRAMHELETQGRFELRLPRSMSPSEAKARAKGMAEAIVKASGHSVEAQHIAVDERGHETVYDRQDFLATRGKKPTIQ